MKKNPETLFHPNPETADDATPIVENAGYAHLGEALEEDAELYFSGGEDSDGDPNDPANVNSRAYNPFLDPTDEPLDLHDGHVRPVTLDQIADVLSESERPSE
jgi:hypothetical protein